MMARTQNLPCRVLTEKEFPAWDHFVSEHPEATAYHLSIWRHILGEAFGKKWYVVGILRDGRIRGGIPLVHMKSSLFGNFLVSMPYVNYGGMLFSDDSLQEPLVQGVIKLAQELHVDHVELRHLKNYEIGLPAKTQKVSMWLSLPDSSEALLKSFKPKLRSQVRKGEKKWVVGSMRRW